MEELKVGLYGRTNLGNIIKFAYLCDENNERYTNKVILIDEVTKSSRPYYYFKEDERIVKESKNIIDLIEVGDYVNGYKVYDISTEYLVDINKEGKILKIEKEGFINATITEGKDDIKSICTKEQFAAVEYKLDN